MQQILIYSDSLSWGIIPDTRRRLDFEQRWPGIVENTLLQMHQSVSVIENCLNGRRTIWQDPFKPGRNGSETLAQVIEMHSPLALVVIMLGSNDFQSTHDNSALLSSQGVATLVNIIKNAAIEPGMPIPEILLVCPPSIKQAKGVIAAKFLGAEKRCVGFSQYLKALASEQGLHFFDANTVTQSSVIDGIHLDVGQHQVFGTAIAQCIHSILKG
ncbi:MAG: SGNH/GDSL hydrolase family protein [Pseudomonadales bacterium]|nr:SGNH/GDSL hydrolase family protein [Pseudomonadales bacterium]